MIILGLVTAKETALQDSGRELDAVLQGIIIRVHHSGASVLFPAINQDDYVN